MKGHAYSIASEQVRAFVAFVHFGNYRAAADSLHLTREGLRRRLLTLENRLRVRLYEKGRGRNTNIRLTREGNAFYTRSVQFLNEAETLAKPFEEEQSPPQVRIALSNYVASNHLGTILRDFHRQFTDIAIQVTAGTEQQVVCAMQEDSRVGLGICACDNFPEGLIRRQLFSVPWCFIAQMGHHLLRQPAVTLAQLAKEPLIMFQPGCPARQRILEAFRHECLIPHVAIQVTTIEMVLNLVEAGIGTAIIPLSRPCKIFRGWRVGQTSIADPIQPIEFSLLAQKDLLDDKVASRLLDCIFDQFGHKRFVEKPASGESATPNQDTAGRE